MVRDSLSSFISRAPQSCGRSAESNGRFEFQKRSQLVIRPHNETLPVVAMCVGNPDRSPVGINGIKKWPPKKDGHFCVGKL
jgi:hypothetical protein